MAATKGLLESVTVNQKRFLVLAGVLALAGLARGRYQAYVREHVERTSAFSAEEAIAGIREAQEAVRAKTGQYVDCTRNLDLVGSLYPRPLADLNSEISSKWDAYVFKCYQLQLERSRMPRSGLSQAVAAGPPGRVDVKGLPQAMPPLPDRSDEPWYVIMVVGDRDDDDDYAYFVASSFDEEVFSQNEED